MMYSAYMLNKQGNNIQPWCTPFPILNQSVVPCPVLTVASWPAYRFLRRQVRWSVIPISLSIFYIFLWSTSLLLVLLSSPSSHSLPGDYWAMSSLGNTSEALWRNSITYFCGEVGTSQFKWRHETTASHHTGDGALDLLTSPEAWRSNIVFFLAWQSACPGTGNRSWISRRRKRALALHPIIGAK